MQKTIRDNKSQPVLNALLMFPALNHADETERKLSGCVERSSSSVEEPGAGLRQAPNKVRFASSFL
jgi:hypothetical protein